MKIYHRFWTSFSYYSILFKWLRPKAIFAINQVGGGITAAANRENIDLYEFQHGFFNRNKPDYHFPKYFLEFKEKIPLPDKIITFGSFFSKIILSSGFWQSNNLIEVGNLEIERYRKQNQHKNDNQIKRILIILQPSCYVEFKEILESLRTENLQELQIVLKPHPAESTDRCKWYKKFSEQNPGNFIYEESKSSILEIMTSVDAVAGFHSTSLFEAAALGKDVFIFSFSEGNDLQTMIEEDIKSHFHIIQRSDEFVKSICFASSNPKTSAQNFGDSIAKRNYKQNVEYFIKNVDTLN